MRAFKKLQQLFPLVRRSRSDERETALMASLAKEMSRCGQLNRTVREMTHEANRLGDEIAELACENKGLKEQLADAERELKIRNTKIEDDEAALDRLGRDLMTVRKHKADLIRAIEEWRERYRKLEAIREEVASRSAMRMKALNEAGFICAKAVGFGPVTPESLAKLVSKN